MYDLVKLGKNLFNPVTSIKLGNFTVQLWLRKQDKTR